MAPADERTSLCLGPAVRRSANRRAFATFEKLVPLFDGDIGPAVSGLHAERTSLLSLGDSECRFAVLETDAPRRPRDAVT